MILLILFFCCELGKVKILKQIHSNEDFTIVTALLGKTGRLSFGVNGALKKFKVKKGTATWDFAINKKCVVFTFWQNKLRMSSVENDVKSSLWIIWSNWLWLG